MLQRAQQTGRTVMLMCRLGPAADVELCLPLDPSMACDSGQETRSQKEQRHRFDVSDGDDSREQGSHDQQHQDQGKQKGQAISHAGCVIGEPFRYRKCDAKPATPQQARKPEQRLQVCSQSHGGSWLLSRLREGRRGFAQEVVDDVAVSSLDGVADECRVAPPEGWGRARPPRPCRSKTAPPSARIAHCR